jgi:hypothetical protein
MNHTSQLLNRFYLVFFINLKNMKHYKDHNDRKARKQS